MEVLHRIARPQGGQIERVGWREATLLHPVDQPGQPSQPRCGLQAQAVGLMPGNGGRVHPAKGTTPPAIASDEVWRIGSFSNNQSTCPAVPLG